MVIGLNFNEKQYLDLQEKLKYSKFINKDFLVDIYNKKLDERLKQLIPSNYLNDTNTDYYNVGNNIISSWINLLREWIYVGVRKDITTYIYWARIKRHPKYIKIGITYDIGKRSEFENNKYYDYHVIRWCKNRYQAAYVEYKVRTLFCNHCNEIVDIKDINEVIDYIKNFHWKKEYKNELTLLGWRF